MTGISVRDDYAPRFGRQQLSLWSGSFANDREGVALELPGHNGYMVDLEYGGRVRVTCEAPRTEENYLRVDDAIAEAVSDYWSAERDRAGRWVALDEEATADYLAGEFNPREVRKTAEGVEALDPHDWAYGLHKICQRCDLLPLDYDALEVECR